MVLEKTETGSAIVTVASTESLASVAPAPIVVVAAAEMNSLSTVTEAMDIESVKKELVEPIQKYDNTQNQVFLCVSHMLDEVVRVLTYVPRYIKTGAKLQDQPFNFYLYCEYLEDALLERMKTPDHETVLGIFKGFFRLYPFCHGYWMRYVEYEVEHYKKSTPDASGEDCLAKVVSLYEDEVLESSAKYIPEIWSHYVATLKEETIASTEFVRSVYERACKLLGNGFNSEALWVEYAQFEGKLGPLGKVGNVELLKKELFTSIALSLIEKEYCISQFYFHPHAVAVEDQTEWISCLQWIEQAHEKRMVEFGAVEHLYERCLVPCAHVEDIWMMFAGWMVKQALEVKGASKECAGGGGEPAGTNGFEKCEAYKEKALNIYERAYNILSGRSVSVGLKYADVLEENGRFEQARAVFKELLGAKGQEGDLETITRYANFERRRSDLAQSVQILTNTLSSVVSDSDVIFLTIRAANLRLQMGRTEDGGVENDCSGLQAGRKIFETSISEYPKLGMLWQAYANYEYDNRHYYEAGTGPEDCAWKRTAKIYDDAISNDRLSRNDRLALWSRYISFLDAESDDLDLVKELRKQKSMYSDNGRSDYILSKKRAREAAADATNTAAGQSEGADGAAEASLPNKKILKVEAGSVVNSAENSLGGEKSEFRVPATATIVQADPVATMP